MLRLLSVDDALALPIIFLHLVTERAEAACRLNMHMPLLLNMHTTAKGDFTWAVALSTFPPPLCSTAVGQEQTSASSVHCLLIASFSAHSAAADSQLSDGECDMTGGGGEEALLPTNAPPSEDGVDFGRAFLSSITSKAASEAAHTAEIEINCESVLQALPVCVSVYRKTAQLFAVLFSAADMCLCYLWARKQLSEDSGVVLFSSCSVSFPLIWVFALTFFFLPLSLAASGGWLHSLSVRGELQWLLHCGITHHHHRHCTLMMMMSYSVCCCCCVGD